MGRATRWLKDLFGFKVAQKHQTEYSVQPKDKNRWTSGSGPLIIPPTITPAEAAWLTSFYSEPDNHQKQHARAVAAATAAAADAAVATAQAAAKVVRLTAQGLGIREKLQAAAKIQTVFRGYLARKALRALKALVKIQALVRGFLVRKQAAATLQRMQALIRSQEIVRAMKAGAPMFVKNSTNENRLPQFQAHKKSLEHPTPVSRRLSAAATNAYDENSKIVEVDTGCWPKSRRANSWISQSGYYDSSATKAAISSPFPSPEYSNTEPLKAKQRSKSAPRRLTISASQEFNTKARLGAF